MRTFDQSAKSSKTVKSIVKSEGMWGSMNEEAETSGGKKKRKGKRGGGKGRSDAGPPGDATAANHSSSEADEADAGRGGNAREDVPSKSLAAPSVAPSVSDPHSGEAPPAAPEEEDHSTPPPELPNQIAPTAPLSPEDILKRFQAKHAAGTKKKGYNSNKCNYFLRVILSHISLKGFSINGNTRSRTALCRTSVFYDTQRQV